MTTYQKLKAENKRLRESLQEVVLRPYSRESILIKDSVKMSTSIENNFFFGSPKVIDKFQGLINLIK